MCKWSRYKCTRNLGKSQHHVLKTIFRLLSSLELTLGGASRMSSHITELIFSMLDYRTISTHFLFILSWMTPLISQRCTLNATLERFWYRSLHIKMTKKNKFGVYKKILAFWFIRWTLLWYPCPLIYSRMGLQVKHWACVTGFENELHLHYISGCTGRMRKKK